MPIKDKNNIPKLKKKLKEAGKKMIRVGILGDAQLALVGASNEFGARIPISPGMRRLFAAKGFPIRKETTEFILPERSWLRTSFDDKTNIKKYTDVAKAIYDINTPLQKTLDAIGLFMVGAVQKRIRSNIKPANHPFTTQEKGGKSKTLINSARLIQGVTHKIV